MRRVTIFAVVTLLGTAALPAQAPRTADAVRAAMTALLRAEVRGPDTLRLAADSTAVWRDYVTCTPVNGAPHCTLTDAKPVSVLHVKMISADSAEVEVQRFRMIDRECVTGREIVPPRITGGLTGTAWWVVRYVGGRWLGSKLDMVATC